MELQCYAGEVMVVIVWQLDIQLPITTKVVSSNPVLYTTLCDKVCQ